VDDVLPAALVDPVQAEAGLTVWAVAAGGLRADDAAWMHRRPPPPLEALAGLVTFSWLDPLTWFDERVDLTVDGQRLERPVTPWSEASLRRAKHADSPIRPAHGKGGKIRPTSRRHD
jgi:hypothetical protein